MEVCEGGHGLGVMKQRGQVDADHRNDAERRRMHLAGAPAGARMVVMKERGRLLPRTFTIAAIKVSYISSNDPDTAITTDRLQPNKGAARPFFVRRVIV